MNTELFENLRWSYNNLELLRDLLVELSNMDAKLFNASNGTVTIEVSPDIKLEFIRDIEDYKWHGVLHTDSRVYNFFESNNPEMHNKIALRLLDIFKLKLLFGNK